MNKKKIVIDSKGKWKLYTNALPKDCTVLGTVTQGEFGGGALVRMNLTGLYVQVNNGNLRNIDGRSVAAALGGIGRPSEMSEGKRVNVYLDSQSLAIAEKVGEGNVSSGIRKALKQITED